MIINNGSRQLKSNKAIELFFYIIIFTFFYLYLLMPIFGSRFEFIPGDLGDSRLNNYFLEHAYRWFSGDVHSFWSAPFFFPYEKVIAFSDNHLGSFGFYAAFRLLNFSMETSYQLWFVVGVILNYFSMVILLRFYRLNVVSICFGALVFALSSIAVYKFEAHSQTLYRFAIPLLWLFHEKYLRSHKTRWLLLKYVFLAYQFYISIYTGYFISLLIFGYSISKFIALKEKPSIASLKKEFIAIIFFLTLIAPLMLPYIELSLLEGYKNSNDAVLSMLPRVQSYLLNPAANPIFGFSWNDIALPMKHEHFMYLGFLPLVSILYFSFCYKRLVENNKDLLFLLLGFWVVFIITLNFNGFSIYNFMLLIPGIDSIRAVARVGLVMLFPAAVFSAFFLEELIKNKFKLVKYLFVGFAFFVWVFEAKVSPYHFEKIAAQSRIAQLKSVLPRDISPDTLIAFLNPNAGSDSFFLTELDAMILTQSIGLATINGYSGRAPFGHRWLSSLDDVRVYVTSVQANGNTSFSFANSPLLILYEVSPNEFSFVKFQSMVSP